MEPTISQGWFNAIGTALIAVCLWVVRMYANKVNRIEQREATYVTRNELEQALRHRDERLDAMHLENTGNFRELRMSLDNINTKLFNLASK